MQITRFALLASLALISGCATAPSTHNAHIHKSHVFAYRHDVDVNQEIAKELAHVESAPEPLKGPITLARLAELEKQTKPSILGDLLAKRTHVVNTPPPEPPVQLKTLNSLDASTMKVSTSSSETPFIFDIPVTYNNRVSNWIRWFQTEGRSSFKRYLERSARYVPVIEDELQRAGLPQDLVYLAMIESGFRADAASHMGAIGLWQFIPSTARRYGLNVSWWIDERRDYVKSTRAAIAYMKELNGEFNSWYLVAASYNMGESGVRRLIKRHDTNNFWELADQKALPRETTDYVPKILAATLIAKAPALYGFRDLEYQVPLSFDTVRVPGGTDLVNLAGYLGVSGKYLMELNPELTRGFIPREVRGHQIRVPKGSALMVSQYSRLQQESGAAETSALERQGVAQE